MENYEVAGILREISILLEMEDTPFKPRAYEKAAIAIESMQENVENIYKQGGIKALKQIPGVGQGIAQKIEELITTGKIQYHEKLKEKVPVDLENLSAIEGLGPKKIKLLWDKLKVRNMADLEEAARAHKISKLPGFKEKTEQNILSGIEFAKKKQRTIYSGPCAALD